MLPSLIDEARLKTLVKIAFTAPLGAFVEFGVYQGGSAQLLYELCKVQGRDLYLYDTFSGIPLADPEIDSHKVGDFGDASEAAIRLLLPEAIVVPGVFPESAIPMPPIAFAHIDCDQYRSVLAACDVFGPLMVAGGLMLFDDYRVLPSCVKAVDERYPQREILPEDGRALVRF